MKIVPNCIFYLHPNSWIFSPFLAILINFLNSEIDLDFPIFNSKSLSNLKKFLWIKLFLSSIPSQNILFQNFQAREGSFWNDQI
jgi:hypothetical protein